MAVEGREGDRGIANALGGGVAASPAAPLLLRCASRISSPEGVLGPIAARTGSAAAGARLRGMSSEASLPGDGSTAGENGDRGDGPTGGPTTSTLTPALGFPEALS